MYSIYCNGSLIFSPAMQQQSYALTDIILKEEDGKIATLEMRVPPVNVGFGSINLLTSQIVLYSDAAPIFAGRPISIRKDFYGNLVVVCAAAIAYLNDTVWEDLNASYATSVADLASAILANHNGDVVDAKRTFTLGNYPSSGYSSSGIGAVDTPTTTFDTLCRFQCFYTPQDSPYLIPSVRYAGSPGNLTLYLDLGLETDVTYGTQTIEFGKNLLDLDAFIDAKKMFTILDFWDVDNSYLYAYYENPMISQYGVIRKLLSFAGINNEHSQNPAIGRQIEASAYYTANARAVQTIKLSALDMSLAGLAADRFEVGKYYQVISAPHGLNTYYKCVRAVRRLLEPSKDVYEFGVTQKPLTRLLTS